MHKKTRSLLEELESISENRDIKHIIESRAYNIITSAINLLEMINKNYDSEKSAILERKLLIAIKNRDQNKFTNSIKKQNKDAAADEKISNETSEESK